MAQESRISGFEYREIIETYANHLLKDDINNFRYITDAIRRQFFRDDEQDVYKRLFERSLDTFIPLAQKAYISGTFVHTDVDSIEQTYRKIDRSPTKTLDDYIESRANRRAFNMIHSYWRGDCWNACPRWEKRYELFGAETTPKMISMGRSVPSNWLIFIEGLNSAFGL